MKGNNISKLESAGFASISRVIRRSTGLFSHLLEVQGDIEDFIGSSFNSRHRGSEQQRNNERANYAVIMPQRSRCRPEEACGKGGRVFKEFCEKTSIRKLFALLNYSSIANNIIIYACNNKDGLKFMVENQIHWLERYVNNRITECICSR